VKRFNNRSRIAILWLACALLIATAIPGIAATSAFDQAFASALGGMNVYFGNLHAHTAYSDGTGTPAQGYQVARTAGLDFYCVTDHSEMIVPPEWQDTCNAAQSYNQKGKFAAMTGFEWTGGGGHVNVFNTASYRSTYDYKTVDSLAAWVRSAGGFAQFNHPASGISFNEFRLGGRNAQDTMRLVETGNSGAGNNTGFFYDYFIKALDKGWVVAPTSNQDNHSLKINCHRTGVVAPGLTREDITAALAARRVYSSDDQSMQLVFKCGADWMGSDVAREAGKQKFSVLVKDDEDIDNIQLVSNGGQVLQTLAFKSTEHNKQVLWEPEVDFQQQRAYYFVKVTERDTNNEDESHRGKQVAISAPIWLSHPRHDVSIKVAADDGIIAERPLYFSYHGAWAGGSTESGVTQPGKTWFLAEGSTWPGFEEWVCIQNPGEVEAVVWLTCMMQAGGNIVRSVKVGPHSRFTVDINSMVGPSKDVSVRLDASQPIVVERPMYFDYHGCQGGSISAAVPAAGKSWYLAEGATHAGFVEWLSLMNPGGSPAHAVITYMFNGGGTQRQDVVIPPTTRRTVNVNDVVGPGHDVSAVVSSDQPIIAERPMYFDYHGMWSGGSSQPGTTSPGTAWYFAEGTTRANRADGYYDEWLSVQNPGSLWANIKVTYMYRGGGHRTTPLSVPPRSRITIDVNKAVGPDQDISAQILSDRPVVAERPIYFSYHSALQGGDVEMGCKGTSTTWYFAEGTNRDGFEEWLTLQNPQAHKTRATVSLMLDDGRVLDYDYVLAPFSRTTITVNGLLAPL